MRLNVGAKAISGETTQIVMFAGDKCSVSEFYGLMPRLEGSVHGSSNMQADRLSRVPRGMTCAWGSGIVF